MYGENNKISKTYMMDWFVNWLSMFPPKFLQNGFDCTLRCSDEYDEYISRELFVYKLIEVIRHSAYLKRRSFKIAPLENYLY